MRPALAVILVLASRSLLPAQPNETVHPVGKDGLTLAGRLEASDPKVRVTVAPGKSGALLATRYLVKLAGGKKYQLTMRSKELDSFLVVQNARAEQVAFDDDSGGGLDAMLTLDVKEDT